MADDLRYPYIYASDFICGLAGYNSSGIKLSRADGSDIRKGIARALGMTDEKLAKKLADYYLANQDEITKQSTKELLQAIGRL